MCHRIALWCLSRKNPPVELSIPQVPSVGANAATVHRIKCACPGAVTSSIMNGPQVHERDEIHSEAYVHVTANMCSCGSAQQQVRIHATWSSDGLMATNLRQPLWQKH